MQLTIRRRNQVIRRSDLGESCLHRVAHDGGGAAVLRHARVAAGRLEQRCRLLLVMAENLARQLGLTVLHGVAPEQVTLRREASRV